MDDGITGTAMSGQLMGHTIILDTIQSAARYTYFALGIFRLQMILLFDVQLIPIN